MLLMPKVAADLLCYDLPATDLVENVHAVAEWRSSFHAWTMQQKWKFHQKMGVSSLLNT
jgi:hypothetical protein